MSKICGIFCTDNNLCSIDFDLMMQSCAGNEADTTAVWHNGHIAIGQQTTWVTPESVNEPLPLYKSGPDLTIAGDIRLDNREDLFIKLGIQRSDQSSIGDAELVLASFCKWNESCPEHLSGDFAFVIWSNKKQQLFCCRDHFGKRGLYYYYTPGKFVFSTDIKPLLAVQGVKSGVNKNKLVSFVVPGADNLFLDESWYEDIFPVPSSTILTVDKTGIKKRKYWTPEILPEPVFKNEVEYAEAFQEIFFKAVTSRLRSNTPVCALLSGGLDSSAIVSVAAKVLEKQNKELQVFSVVLPDQNDKLLTDERYFIDQFRTYPNVKINYISPLEMSFFTSFEKFKSNNNLLPIYSRNFLFEAFSDRARALGSRVILNGSSGELGATSAADGYYAELFSQFRWSKLWHELKARNRLTGESVYYNLTANVIGPFLPPFFIDLLKSQNNAQTAIDHFLQPGFAAELRDLIKGRKKEIQSLALHISPSHRQNQLAMIQVVQNKATAARDIGQIEYRFPFLDKRLLEFCLAMPGDMKVKNGYKRYLIRAGLAGILPPEIQWRNSKSPFSPDYMRHYKAHLPQVAAFFETIQANDPVSAVVDLEKLKSWTKIQVADNEKNNHKVQIARELVPRAVYLICFLRRFKEFQLR